MLENSLKQSAEFSNLAEFFDNFIKDGVVKKEEMVAPNFNVRVRALSVEEVLEAEMKIQKATEGITIQDIYLRVRACSILSIAIEKIGDKEIYTEEELEDKNEQAISSRINKQASMYLNLIKLPPQLIEKIYSLYLKAVAEQSDLYKNPDKIVAESENFSTHPMEE